MKIHDFVLALTGGDIYEFHIYADDEQPAFEGLSREIPEEYMEAEIDCFSIGTAAIGIVIK